MAVHSINTEHDGDTETRVQCRLLVGIGAPTPARRFTQAAIGDQTDDRTEVIFTDIVWCRHSDVGLHQLSDFLRQRHGRYQLRDIRLFQASPVRRGQLGGKP